MNGKRLTAEPRELTGKNNNNRLRVDGLIPAVLYSHGKTEAIQLKGKDFFNLFKGEISESIIFNIDIAGKSDEAMAFVKDFQLDPVTGSILHLDLFKVTKGEKIRTNIPLELIGTPVGLKMGGILVHGEREISVECMPKDLPEKIEVDISALELGDIIIVSDLVISDAVEVLTTQDNVIAAVDRPRAEEVEEEVEEGEGEAGEETEESTDEVSEDK